MDNSSESAREYLPVHPDLKVYSIQEFYSVPAQYLVLLEQDMQTYGNFVKYFQSIRCESAELESVLMRMETRVDNVWTRYLNYIREGASQVRLIQLREINRKIWYAANMLCTFLTSTRTLSDQVFFRRTEFILGDMDDVADSVKGEGGLPFEAWQPRFLIRIHKII